jgi:hypothetical protein
MIIEKQTKIGTVKIDIPINFKDRICQGNTHYNINRIIVVENQVFAVNTYSGLWIEIEKLELIKQEKDIKYFKIIKED